MSDRSNPNDTIPDGEYTAVLDRFDDDIAVLLVEETDETGESTVIGDVDLHRDMLPRRGAREGAVFTISLVDDELITIEYEKRESMRRRSSTEDRFD